MGGHAVVLLLTDVTFLPGTVVIWAMKYVSEKIAAGAGLSILTQASHFDGKLQVESSSVDAIISLAETPGHHSAAWLGEYSRALRSGGDLFVQEPVTKRDISPEEVQSFGKSDFVVQTQSALQKSLLLAGFVSSTTVDAVEEITLAPGLCSVTPDSVGSRRGPLFQPVAFKVKKPTWETGSSFSLKKKSVIKQEEVAKPNGTANGRVSLLDMNDFNIDVAPPTNGVISWKIVGVDVENDELVDEDSLLTEEDLKKPEVSLVDDCEVEQGGRKACKNCTCGRAEIVEKQEAQPETKLTLGQINNPQSACGSCGLGDAFRCNGCPYRGLPAFKLGEKIALPGSFLTADI